MTTSDYQDVTIQRDGVAARDRVAVESPLEIRVGRLPLAVMMRTPGYDHDLVAGLLLTEGIVASVDDIHDIRHCDDVDADSAGNVVIADLADGVVFDPVRFRRNLPGYGGCGVCGRTVIEHVRGRMPPLGDGLRWSRAALAELPAAMARGQAGFAQTGGLHAAALFDPRGAARCVREDIGRHNAVDKVIGWAARETGLPCGDDVLVVSSRAGFEIVQKAIAAGIQIVASVSAASSMAIELAEEAGLTLAGFVRDGTMNVYAHPDRLTN
jgi:FdhD protein